MSKSNNSTKRKTEQDYIALAERRGFIWVGEFPQSTNYKTHWQCPKGHIWTTSYHLIRNGNGCPHCSKRVRITDEHCVALAHLRGYEFLGPSPVNNKTMLRWRCGQGHEWNMSYRSIHQGRGCPTCSHHVPHTEASYHSLAATKSLIWLGPFPQNSLSETLWQCLKCDYIWETTYQRVNQYNCPLCLPTGRKAPVQPDEYHTIARSRGYEWVGEFPSNVTEKTLWRCPVGHEWMASYTKIRTGRSCPKCQNRVNGHLVSTPQCKLCEMIDGELNYPVGPYRIDVALFIDGHMIGLEYDAAMWHIPHKDAKRDAYLIHHGWRMLRVKSMDSLPTYDQLNTAIALLLAGETYAEIALPDWKG